MFAGSGVVVCFFDVQVIEILHENVIVAVCEFPQGQACLLRALDRPIVQIGDVHDMLDFVSFKFHIPSDQIRKNDSSALSQIDFLAQGGAAGIHLYTVFMDGNELFFFSV